MLSYFSGGMSLRKISGEQKTMFTALDNMLPVTYRKHVVQSVNECSMEARVPRIKFGFNLIKDGNCSFSLTSVQVHICATIRSSAVFRRKLILDFDIEKSFETLKCHISSFLFLRIYRRCME